MTKTGNILEDLKNRNKELSEKVAELENFLKAKSDLITDLREMKEIDKFSLNSDKWHEKYGFELETIIETDFICAYSSGRLSQTTEKMQSEIDKIDNDNKNRKIKELNESLDKTCKKTKELETLLEGEKEAHQSILSTQLSFYRREYSDEFAELEERVGEEGISVNKWLPNLIQFLQWKEQKARFKKEEVERQKDKLIRQKNKINSKHQNQIQNLKSLVQSRKETAHKLEQTKAQRQFLIQKALELSKKHLKVDREMRWYENLAAELVDELSKEKIIIQSYQAYKEQRDEIKRQNQQDHQVFKDRINSLTGQNTYLQEQIKNHTCSGCHIPTHIDYNQIKRENQNLTTEKTNLERSLLQKMGQLVEEKTKTRKARATKRAQSLLAQKLHLDLSQVQQDKDNLNSLLTEAQNNSNTLLNQRDDLYIQLAQFNQDLENRQNTIQNLNQEKVNQALAQAETIEKELKTQIGTLEDKTKEQEQELNQQKEQNQQFETEKENWEQEKQQWQQREKALLAEIELLKNPPNQANKENVPIERIEEKVVEQVKELSKELTIEQVKKVSAILSEQNHLFNQKLKQKGEEMTSRERERERNHSRNYSIHLGINNSWANDLVA
jgi:hypothetical protein